MAKKPLTTEAAAELIGAKPDEVDRVDDSPAGPIIVTRDGQSLVLVDEANPDSEGKSGLMFLAAPTERYKGNFPVFAGPAPKASRAKAPAPAAPAADPDAGKAPAGEGSSSGDGAPDPLAAVKTGPQLKAFAAAQEPPIEITATKVADIRAEVLAALAERAGA